MNKRRLSTLEHTDQVKITLTSDQIKYIDKQCKKRFNMVNRSHMIRQLIIDSIKKEHTIKDIKKEDNKNYLTFEEYSLVYSVLIDRGYFKRFSKVVFSEEEAKKLNLQIDKDDSLCFGNKPFALLLHGMQEKGSKAEEALKLIKRNKKQLLEV